MAPTPEAAAGRNDCSVSCGDVHIDDRATADLQRRSTDDAAETRREHE